MNKFQQLQVTLAVTLQVSFARHRTSGRLTYSVPAHIIAHMMLQLSFSRRCPVCSLSGALTLLPLQRGWRRVL